MSYAFMKSLSAIRELAVVKSPSIRRYGGITALCFISFYLVIVTFQRPGQVELVNTSNEDYDCFTLQHCGCKRCFKRETLPSNPPGKFLDAYLLIYFTEEHNYLHIPFYTFKNHAYLLKC